LTVANAAQGGAMMRTAAEATPLPVEGVLPPLNGAVEWLNSPPLTTQDLRGKVVLVDFWTYSCINCLRSLPYVKAWAQKYKDQGLVVIGVHAPEFAFERNIDNVKKATHDLGVDYPVAIDNNYAIWRALNNQYWPAHYFVDAKGQIRYHHFGEGDYAESEKVIQQLLTEAGRERVEGRYRYCKRRRARRAGRGRQADMQSPETYVGYQRAENFASPGWGSGRQDAHVCSAVATWRQRLGSRRFMERGRGARHARGPVGTHRVSLSCTRPASGARSGQGWQAGAVSRERRRRRARRVARHRRRRRWQRHRDRTASLSTGAANRRSRGSHFLDRVSGPGVQAFAFTFG
jgi:thiol-disulfide isomerase/thioredoxin